MKKVAIIGFATEGRSALHYWQAQGVDVTVCNRSTGRQIPPGVKTQADDDYLKDLGRFDVVMRSAGIHPDVLLKDNRGIKDKITTTVNEFIRVCPTKNIIGVTGTKGKGTTSTLIAKMLEAAGKKVFLGGNIGRSPFDFLPEVTPESWVVLELSSFQLYDLQHSPHIAVCLMVVSEHLDWHKDLADYMHAKANLFAHQREHDVAIYFAENTLSHKIASASPGKKIAFYDEPGAYIYEDKLMIDQQVVCKTSEIKLLGEHNWQNACAAVTAVWQVVHAPDAMRQVLTTFTGLEHRLELVRELDGVQYYNDSFGTTPETAMVAIQAFKTPKVVILGGSDKGAAFDELAQTVAHGNVRQVILIGNTTNEHHPTITPAIEAALRAQGYEAITSLVKPGGPTMAEIVGAAQSAARSGDIVLLSTGCASFDIFENYKDRGRQFKAAVQAL